MSKNSINLSDGRFCTHNLGDETFKVGLLEGFQFGVSLSYQEAKKLAVFIFEELGHVDVSDMGVAYGSLDIDQ